MRYRTISLLIASLILSSDALALQDKEPKRNNPFYAERERGWFWYEEFPIEEEIDEEPLSPSPSGETPDSSKNEKVRIDAAWIRENLPRFQEEALNNPSRENIARYLYAQRYALDLSSRFANSAMEFMRFESELDESRRRPMSAFSLNVFQDETRNSIVNTINKITSQSHLWFFFSSDCSYCAQQIPVLREMKARFGLDVLAVSLDGGMLPGIEEFDIVVDESGIANQFDVRFTPTILLAIDGGKGFVKLGEGMTSLPDIQDRLLLGARMEGLITNDEYQSTRSVRDINIFSDLDGVMLADAELLESDPGYLAEILRKQLSDRARSPVANEITRGTQ